MSFDFLIYLEEGRGYVVWVAVFRGIQVFLVREVDILGGYSLGIIYVMYDFVNLFQFLAWFSFVLLRVIYLEWRGWNDQKIFFNFFYINCVSRSFVF